MPNVRSSRPRRRDVAAGYDLGVHTYVELWSPVILPPARSVVDSLDLRSSARVLDLGCGSGALFSHLREAAPAAEVIGIDPSREMLRASSRVNAFAVIEGDAVSVPVRTGSVDGVLLAYVLFHVSDPAAALAEVARVLNAAGVVGIVTWVRDGPTPAYAVWDAALTEAGALPLRPARVDSGLNTTEAIDALLVGAGLQTTRAWTQDLEKNWDASTYWQLANGNGMNRRRLQQLEPAVCSDTLGRIRRRFDDLPREAFHWTGQVVCAVGAKPS